VIEAKRARREEREIEVEVEERKLVREVKQNLEEVGIRELAEVERRELLSWPRGCSNRSKIEVEHRREHREKESGKSKVEKRREKFRA